MAEFEYDSGPYCRHYADPSGCDQICDRPGCGHRCAEHDYFNPGDCLIPGCLCQAFVEES